MMAAAAFRCRVLVLGLCLLLSLLPPELHGDKLSSDSDPARSCDEGKVGGDIEDLEKWTSCQEHLSPPSKLMQPSHLEECVPTVEESHAKCVDHPLAYSRHPPSSGDYRPLLPKYGTYQYLPPQRWLSALQYGAVVFLYHPCTPPDQVSQLSQLARSCLWRHFISPYPHLNLSWPMAVVSWGCVLRVRWVESEKIREWVSSHALHTPLAAEVATDGSYADGLLHPAEKVETDGKEIVCPSHSPPLTNLPSPSTTSSNKTNNRNPESQSKPICPSPTHQNQSTHNERGLDCRPPPTDQADRHSHPLSLHHHFGYAILILVACVALLCVFLVFVFNVCRTTRSRTRRARYKSVSKFFPFSYGDGEQLEDERGSEGVSVAIPEYGLPKSGRAEREMLLNESDEDEI